VTGDRSEPNWHRRRANSEGLAPAVAAEAYDRIGRLQDTQAPFERPALDRLVAAGDFEHANAVFELGCGTGSLARRLHRDKLPPGCSYLGGDVSARMVGLARERVVAWADRAKILHLDGSLPLPVPDGSFDRFVATYVLDLLDSDYARRILDNAHRLLLPGGRLCLSSLTSGQSRVGRAVARAWSALWLFAPRIVGGCRPIDITELLNPAQWSILENTTVESWGFPSQVLVATAL